MVRHKNTISLKRGMCAGRNLHEPEFDPAKRKNPGPRGKCQKKRSKLRGTYSAKEIRYLEINLVRGEKQVVLPIFLFKHNAHARHRVCRRGLRPTKSIYHEMEEGKKVEGRI